MDFKFEEVCETVDVCRNLCHQLEKAQKHLQVIQDNLPDVLASIERIKTDLMSQEENRRGDE